METQTFLAAIEAAQARGCVPFVAVVPVTPELLRDSALPVERIVGEMAAKEVAGAVRAWQAQDHG